MSDSQRSGILDSFIESIPNILGSFRLTNVGEQRGIKEYISVSLFNSFHDISNSKAGVSLNLILSRNSCLLTPLVTYLLEASDRYIVRVRISVWAVTFAHNVICYIKIQNLATYYQTKLMKVAKHSKLYTNWARVFVSCPYIIPPPELNKLR